MNCVHLCNDFICFAFSSPSFQVLFFFPPSFLSFFLSFLSLCSRFLRSSSDFEDAAAASNPAIPPCSLWLCVAGLLATYSQCAALRLYCGLSAYSYRRRTCPRSSPPHLEQPNAQCRSRDGRVCARRWKRAIRQREIEGEKEWRLFCIFFSLCGVPNIFVKLPMDSSTRGLYLLFFLLFFSPSNFIAPRV